jgi:hypothetical protein
VTAWQSCWELPCTSTVTPAKLHCWSNICNAYHFLPDLLGYVWSEPHRAGVSDSWWVYCSRAKTGVISSWRSVL